MLRRTAALAALTLAASLATVSTSAAQAADPTLVVPDSPSGDVVVTATADPATAPYLAVRLVLGAAPTAPYDGIDPAPVANPGSAVEVTVPTWGLHQDQSTFVLLGCASAEPDSCTTLLASQLRAVTQTLGASATVELPDASPIFVPEDEVYVTAQNDGGGVIQAYINEWRDEPREYQQLASGERTLFTTFPDAAESGARLQVRRCSALTSSSSYCTQVSSTPIKFIASPTIWTLTNPYSGIPITLNQAWSGSTRSFDATIFTAGAPYELSWELRDEAGQVVAGPVAVGGATTAVSRMIEVNPGHAAGGLLPDGEYAAVFTAKVARGDLTKSASASRPVTIMASPPRQDAPLLTAIRKVYPSSNPAVDQDGGLFRVAALSSTSTDYRVGRFRLRAPGGRVVHTRVLEDPCSDPTRCSRSDSWDMGELPLRRPGRYRAELTYPDPWGRPTTKDLGAVYVMEKGTARTPVTVSGSASRLSTYLYRARVPAKHGELDKNDSPFVEVFVRGQGRSTVRFECRVPSISLKWQRDSWRTGETWRSACSYFPRGKSLDGRTIQIRVYGKGGGRFRMQQIRVVHVYGVWRMPK